MGVATLPWEIPDTAAVEVVHGPVGQMRGQICLVAYTSRRNRSKCELEMRAGVDDRFTLAELTSLHRSSTLCMQNRRHSIALFLSTWKGGLLSDDCQ